MPLTAYGENLLANFAFNGESITRPTGWWVALHSQDPGVDGDVGECVGAGYSRAQATFSASDDGRVANDTADVEFPVSLSAWGTMTHISVWDAVEDGNCLLYNALLSPVIVSVGGHVIFPAGSLAIQVGV